MLKRIFLILILPIFIYAQWTDPRPRSVQLWHMAEGVIDSLTVSAFYADTLEAKETTLSEDIGGLIRLNGFTSSSNYGAGLFLITNTSYTPDGANVIGLSSGSNQLVRLTDPIVEDTLKLKNLPPLWQTINLKQLSSSNTNGGGMFVYADSTYPEGAIAFGVATSGSQLLRDGVKEGRIQASWAGGDFHKLADAFKSAAFVRKPTLYLDDTLTVTTADTLRANIVNVGGLIKGTGSVRLDTVFISSPGKQVFSRETVVSGFASNQYNEVAWFTPYDNDSTLSDSSAFANAVRISYDVTRDRGKELKFADGKYLRIHEVDLPTVTGVNSPKIKFSSGSTINGFVTYDGAGGTGSHLIKLGGLSFGAITDLYIVGIPIGSVPADTAESLILSNYVIDMNFEIRNVVLVHAKKYGLYHKGGNGGVGNSSIVNAYFRKFRADAIGEAIFYFDFGTNQTQENRQLVISDFTFDNILKSGKNAIVGINNPQGIDLKLENARIEYNTDSEDSTGVVFIEGHESGDVIRVTFDHISGYTSVDTQVDYLVSTDAASLGGVDFTMVDCDLRHARSMIGYNRGSGLIEVGGIPFNGKSGTVKLGGNTQQVVALNIGDRKILYKDRNGLAAIQSEVKYGDIIYLTDNFTLPAQGATRYVAWPWVGNARSLAGTIATVTADSGDVSFTATTNNTIVRVGTNIKIPGAHWNGGDLYTRVTAIDLANRVYTIVDTVRTDVSGVSATNVAPEYRDYPYAKASAAPTTEHWLLGEIVLNSAPVSGGKLGWICVNQGEAHTASTGTISNGSAAVTSVTNVSTWAIGDAIEGYGIPASTIIRNISGTTITMSQNATADSSGNALYDAQFKTYGAID